MLTTILGLLGSGGLMALIPGGFGVAGILATLFGFFKAKTPFMLIGVLVVALAGVAYHFATKAGFESQLKDYANIVAQKTAENSGLKSDKERLLISNNSLETALETEKKLNEELLRSIERLQADDEAITKKLQELQEQIDSAPDAPDASSGNGQSELFINELNKDLKCELANFHRFDGRCVNGKWESSR